MPDQTEQRLRAASLWHAAQLDPDMIVRLRSVDYRARLGLPERFLRLLGSMGVVYRRRGSR